MAPTAAMLLLSHHGKKHSPSVTQPPASPPATLIGLKGSARKWLTKEIPTFKAGSDHNQTRCVVDPSAVEKRIEEALQLCSC